MSYELPLPQSNGALAKYRIGESSNFKPPTEPLRSRIAYSAAHVVCDPLADYNPSTDARLDWDATLAYRRHLWSYGLAVAEAMDTAQRGMGLDWTTAQELIRRSLAEAKAVGGRIACGAGTDHLVPGANVKLEDVERAYEEQCAFVESTGGRVILMASRALARCARGADDYRRVYARILTQVKQPVILHWLGDMFDLSLKGYWGTSDLDEATNVCVGIINEHKDKIDGIKISLLDDKREVDMRRRLPAGVRMYTGDDFNYDRLIYGDEQGYSDALLGIFDAIAPAASAALQAFDNGDTEAYDRILGPTIPLSRHIFQAPTQFYKTGIVFLAYLNNHQTHFRMIGAQESARSIVHLAKLFELADQAHLFVDPELAVVRMRRVLALSGIE